VAKLVKNYLNSDFKHRVFKALVLLAFSATLGGCIESSREATPSLADKYNGKVVLYATSWCSYCQKTRELFSEHNIGYIEYDIEASGASMQEFKALGGKGVPLVLAKSRVVEGYAPKAVLKLLQGS